MEEYDMLPNQNSDSGNEDDDSNWVLGVFYFNPNDKRLFPPKRIKWLGWTVNFANPYSIAAMVLLLMGLVYVRLLFK